MNIHFRYYMYFLTVKDFPARLQVTYPFIHQKYSLFRMEDSSSGQSFCKEILFLL